MEKKIMKVGIDFATSTSVVRWRMSGSDEVHSVKDSCGDSNADTIPTIILRNRETGVTQYGNAAVKQLEEKMTSNDYEQIVNFKMDLLDPDKRAETKGNITEFLKFVYGLFDDQTKGMDVDDYEVSISYPAKWEPDVIQLMKDAVVDAGFHGTVRGVKEPTAAALNILNKYKDTLQQEKYLLPGKPLYIFMLDMGAGTTDISIFKLTVNGDGVPEISDLMSYPSISEPVLCGGREIDECFVGYLKEYVKSKGVSLPYMDEMITPFAMKQWKEAFVSPNLRNGIKVTLPKELKSVLNIIGQVDVVNRFSMTKREFEEATRDHWQKLYGLVASAMNQYGRMFRVGAEDIDFVCLTGGHSSWYTVPQLFNGEGVCGTIGKKGEPGTLNFKKLYGDSKRMGMFADSRPQECVATGLCFVDEKIRIEDRSPNNVWVKISLNGGKSDAVKVISKGDILPMEKEVVKETTITKKMLGDDDTFFTDIDIFIGEELNHRAIHKKKRLLFDKNSWFIDLIVFLLTLGGGFFGKYEMETKVVLKCKMTKEGLLKLNGEFIAGNESLKFTDKDLETMDFSNN